MVLLVYEGVNHGFQKKTNQIDYHRRILEWFGHYLKGEPPPPVDYGGHSVQPAGRRSASGGRTGER